MIISFLRMPSQGRFWGSPDNEMKGFVAGQRGQEVGCWTARSKDWLLDKEVKELVKRTIYDFKNSKKLLFFFRQSNSENRSMVSPADTTDYVEVKTGQNVSPSQPRLEIKTSFAPWYSVSFRVFHYYKCRDIYRPEEKLFQPKTAVRKRGQLIIQRTAERIQ